LLQKLGSLLREHYGEDILITGMLDLIKIVPPEHNVVVTDMRTPREMAALKEAGFTTIKITRKDRPIDRDQKHSTEVGLADATFDLHLENDGTIEEFKDKIEK